MLDEHRLRFGESEFVFGRDGGRWPFSYSGVRGRALRAWKRADLPSIGFHECRHTFASIAIAAGVNAKALADYMGHASIQTTFDLYGHLMPGNEAEAARLLDGYLSREAAASESGGRFSEAWDQAERQSR